jgi:hypothetical protein
MFLNDPKISRVVFFPRRTEQPKHTPDYIKILKFYIRDDVKIGGIFFLKDKSLPTILLFHGNGEVALDYRGIYSNYFECGVNLAVMDFRGYGFSSHEPTYMSLIDDALPLYNKFCRYRKEQKLQGSLFVQGRSLGSVCAAEIGSHNPKELKGIIFESGFASLYNMMTRLFNIEGPQINPESLKQYSNHTRVKKFQKPTLIIHGTNDWIIPTSEGKLLYNSIPEKVDKKLVLIEGAGHNNIFLYKNEYFTPLQQFKETYK